MEAISAPAAEASSPTKKSANGVGVKSTANGINGAAADGDKKGTKCRHKNLIVNDLI